MCRNIKTLHNFDPPASDDEVHAAALQYVRKISGSTKPSKANEAAFARAVEEVTAASARLLGALVTTAPPRDREACERADDQPGDEQREERREHVRRLLPRPRRRSASRPARVPAPPRRRGPAAAPS